MRKLLIAAFIALLGGILAAQALAATRSVKVGDDYFIRKGTHPTITVHRGDVVRFVWRGSDLHNVAVKSGPVKFHSSYKDSGSFSHRMTRTGTYRMICTVHQPGMRMTIRVVS